MQPARLGTGEGFVYWDVSNSAPEAVCSEIENAEANFRRVLQSRVRSVAFKWNWEVPGDKVQARVEGGWVTLEGELEWKYQSDAATKARPGLECVLALRRWAAGPAVPDVLSLARAGRAVADPGGSVGGAHGPFPHWGMRAGGRADVIRGLRV